MIPHEGVRGGLHSAAGLGRIDPQCVEVLINGRDNQIQATTGRYSGGIEIMSEIPRENPFDIEALMGQCGGKKEIAGMVLAEFVNQTPKDIAEIEGALASGDLVLASKGAHRLKGTAGVIGAKQFHALCAELELACRNDDAAAAPGFFARLKEVAGSCIAYVPVLLTRL